MSTKQKKEIDPVEILSGQTQDNIASGASQARVTMEPEQYETDSAGQSESTIPSAVSYNVPKSTVVQQKITFPEGATNEDKIQSMIDYIMNRNSFEYDFSQDPMYQMYADQYQRKGKLAMLDTMAQAAALTGGYGNTYAQQAGQQAYQRYMEDMMANIVPSLRTQAYQVYQDELAGLRDDLGMLQAQEEMDREQERWQAEYDLALQQAKASGGGGGSSGGGSIKYPWANDKDVQTLQDMVRSGYGFGNTIYLPSGSMIGSSPTSVAAVSEYRNLRDANANKSAIGSNASSVSAVSSYRKKNKK